MTLKLITACLIINLSIITENVEASNSICYKKTYNRGVGEPLSTCQDKYYEERDGALCYPKCKDGYTGCGPICWEDCRPGYDNHGATCCKLNKLF
jgi:hypothetical protein